jgi:hypothetical protein
VKISEETSVPADWPEKGVGADGWSRGDRMLPLSGSDYLIIPMPHKHKADRHRQVVAAG